MKQFSFIFLLITLSTIKLLAQDVCGTPAPAPPSWIFGTPTTSQQRILQSSNTDSYTLNIYLHIVRSSSGSGLNTSISSSIISLLNTNFLGSRIQFNLLGCDYINDNNYYNDCSKKESQLCAVNNIPNAINIYVLGTSTVWNYGDYPYLIPLAGNASSIPSTSLILSGNSYNTLTLPHEMGHCLGLFHTFHGTVREVGSLYTTDDSQCAELVNGGNSATCGDYISDTPADPNKWSNCTYNGSIQDANGDSYKPDPRNIMSYSGNSCRNLFTAIQSERMRNFILNTPALQNAIHREVSGPSQICTQGTYTIDVAGATVVWSATPSGVVSLQPSGSSVILARVSDGKVTLSATINNSYTVTKSNIQVGTVVPPFGLYRGTSGVSSGVVGKNYTFKAYGANTSTNDLDYYWTITPPNLEDDFPSEFGGAEFDFVAAISGYYTVTLSCNGGCGWSDPVTKTFYFQESMGFALSPNPASKSTTISMTSSNNASKSTLLSTSVSSSVSTSYSVSVLDAYGSIVYKGKKSGKQFTIPTASLRNGVYSVIISDGTNSYQNKLIVKH